MKRSTHPIALKSQKWIAEALVHLMTTKNFREITITEICTIAEVDRRTFYRNFSSKEDIIDYYANILKDDFILQLKQLDDITIFNYIQLYFEFWMSCVPLLNSLRQGGMFEIVLRKIDSVFPEIYETFHEPSTKNKIYGMTYTNGGLWNALNRWLETGSKETPFEMATILSEIITSNQSYWSPLA